MKKLVCYSILCAMFSVFGLHVSFAQQSNVYLGEGEPFVWFLPCETTDTVIYRISLVENGSMVMHRDTIIGNVVVFQNPLNYYSVQIQTINNVSFLDCAIKVRFYRRE